MNGIYPEEFQLNKANVSDTEASFVDLFLSTAYDTIPTKTYDKLYDFGFDIVNFLVYFPCNRYFWKI